MTAGRQPVLLVIGQMVCIPQERGGEMKMKRSKMAAFALAAALSVSMAVPAFAAGYEFSGLQPGGNFYQVTEHGQDNEANSGTIIVGADGTIGTDPTAKPRMTPLNGIETPVGEYPDSWVWQRTSTSPTPLCSRTFSPRPANGPTSRAW